MRNWMLKTDITDFFIVHMLELSIFSSYIFFTSVTFQFNSWNYKNTYIWWQNGNVTGSRTVLSCSRSLNSILSKLISWSLGCSESRNYRYSFRFIDYILFTPNKRYKPVLVYRDKGIRWEKCFINHNKIRCLFKTEEGGNMYV